MVHLFVEIKGGFDSKRLWSLIAKYGINLTDLDAVVLVYGDVAFNEAVDIVAYCSMFGEVLKSDFGR